MLKKNRECASGKTFNRSKGRCVKEKSIYKILKATGVEIDHHESDLYVRATPETVELTKNEESREFFTSNVDGLAWIDLPFRYDPYWDKVAERNKKQGGK